MDDEVTPAQHGYLQAFDQWLRASSVRAREDADAAMGVMLDLMREAAPPPKRTNTGGGHARWHVQRGIVRAGCSFCEAMLREAA